jgi:hypothetical protein
MEQMLLNELHDPPVNITKSKITPFAQAMPDQYKDENAVIAYRKYYINEKVRFAKWQYSEEPEWFRLKEPEFLLYEEIPF